MKNSDDEFDPRQQDRQRHAKIAATQRLIDEGLRSGVGQRSANELFEEGLKRAMAQRDNG